MPADFKNCLDGIARRLSFGDGSASDEDRSDANAFIIGVANIATRAMAPVVPIKQQFAPWELGQMKFKATDEMAIKLAWNACDAAGLAIDINKINIDVSGPKAGIFIGDVGGIPINIHLKKAGTDEWYIDEHLTDVEKHRWLRSYKNVGNLLNSVRGIRLGVRDADPKRVAEREAAEAKVNAENAAKLEKDREVGQAKKRTPEERQAQTANKKKATAEHNAPVVDPDAVKPDPKPTTGASKPATVPPAPAPAKAKAGDDDDYHEKQALKEEKKITADHKAADHKKDKKKHK